jgi:DNA-binding MarR family transcriptional regulator
VTDELEAIRERHQEAEHDNNSNWAADHGAQAHFDRETLLRLLDAAREELREVKKATVPFVETLEADIGSEEEDEDLFRPVARHTNCAPLLTVGHFRRLAAALTRAQGESS